MRSLSQYMTQISQMSGSN